MSAEHPFVLTAAQMRAVERAAVDDLGVPGLVLMENAGRGVADVVARERPRTAGLRVCVVCGAGSNGADGFVAARHLALRGAQVRVLLCAPRDKVAAAAGDASLFLRVLEAGGGVVVEDLSMVTDRDGWRLPLANAEVIVDAIFGTGLRDQVRGAPAAAIAGINASTAFKVSVDVPSGVDADTGRALGEAVRADIMVSMGCRKLGVALDPESPAGRVEVVDIGIDIRPALALGPFCHWLERGPIFARLPHRRAGAHKGSSGHVLLIAGSVGKTGAAVLAAQAAFRAGAGLVTIMSTAAGQTALDAKVVEAMSARYSDGDDADAHSYDTVSALAGRMRAAAIGPGIPTGPGMRSLVERVAGGLPLPLVMDADALNLLGPSALSVSARATAAGAVRILTPHPGEAARLLTTTAAAVQADRLACARRLARESGSIVVLKGARTVVAAADGTAHVNPAANPALATAGSGDVLTGVLAALLAQGLDAQSAAIAAVFLHGLAGDLAAQRVGVIAGDLPDALAAVMSSAVSRTT